MSPDEAIPRFQGALERARADWAVADAAACAALAGCSSTPAGVLVPFFGRPHLVTHPQGDVTVLLGDADPAGSTRSGSSPEGQAAHVATVIAVLHYLLTADGCPLADSWIAFRELPDGLFYAQAFARRAEQVLARAFAATDEAERGIADRRRAALALGGEPLGLGNASFGFHAFPRVPVAVLLWTGDDEQPGEAGVLFDASAGHYLPAEDAAGLGEWLAHQLVRAASG